MGERGPRTSLQERVDAYVRAREQDRREREQEREKMALTIRLLRSEAQVFYEKEKKEA
jgi:hypothetical protein